MTKHTVVLFVCLENGLQYGSALRKTMFDSSLQWSAVSRLFLIATAIFSLKEAAEADRLSRGNTFIQLNLMVGAWALLGKGKNERLDSPVK